MNKSSEQISSCPEDHTPVTQRLEVQDVNSMDEDDFKEDENDSRQFAILDETGDSDDNSPPTNRFVESESEEEITAEEYGKIPEPDKAVYIAKEKLMVYNFSPNELEDLPPDWIMKEYAAGIPFYVHVHTNVISTTRPYSLGTGSIKKHKLCANAIPCLDYIRTRNKIEETQVENCNPPNVQSEKVTSELNMKVPETEPCTVDKADAQSELSNIIDGNNTECHADSVQKHKENFLSHEEAIAYFKKLYRHRTIKIRKFSSWKMKRAFVHKQKCKNKITKNVTAAPEGMIVIKVPKLNIHTNKLEMSDWTLNPNGKSYVCLLHEYLQRAVKTHPVYEFKELENAKTPYMAIIKLNNMQYGSGIGSSKKVAKLEAARATLEILIPQLNHLWRKDDTIQDDSTYILFDNVHIRDPNVRLYCKSLHEVQPYAMLQSCVKKNFDDSHRILESIRSTENENIFCIKVGDYSASVKCNSKSEGRQRASQKLLQKLHPQVHYLGSLLRLYGNAVTKGIKEKKSGSEEQKASKRNLNDDAPNLEVLGSLRETMNVIYADRKHLLEQGQFDAPADIDQTVMNMYFEMKEKCKKSKRNNTGEPEADISETNVLEKEGQLTTAPILSSPVE